MGRMACLLVVALAALLGAPTSVYSADDGAASTDTTVSGGGGSVGGGAADVGHQAGIATAAAGAGTANGSGSSASLCRNTHCIDSGAGPAHEPSFERYVCPDGSKLCERRR